jgi:dTDP-L-rhamnose 4-epimerase
MRVLITGGAGFIGVHLARRLLQEGYTVTVFDNFNPQVHGGNQTLPLDLAEHVRLIIGDVRDQDAFHQALDDQEIVVHLAAETGTGQSMYRIAHYSDVNIGGTAILLDYLVNRKNSRTNKIVVASSRAVYGEGKYACTSHGIVYPSLRTEESFKAGRFEPTCPVCGQNCLPLPTDEGALIAPTSIYGITKHVQEQMALLIGRTIGISALALRYQNVYGPGQSLQNPYTGILAIFSSLARAERTINIFEDGKESRDFIFIDDVIEATYRCIKTAATSVEVFNIGSGIGISVLEVAQATIKYFGSKSQYIVSGDFRLGDIRHNIADISKARHSLGFKPEWSFDHGFREFLAWASEQPIPTISYDQSLKELRARGLLL